MQYPCKQNRNYFDQDLGAVVTLSVSENTNTTDRTEYHLGLCTTIAEDTLCTHLHTMYEENYTSMETYINQIFSHLISLIHDTLP